MGETRFDIEGLKQVLEAGDADKVLEFYSNDLEHIEVDEGAPPKSPRASGADYIRNAIEGILGFPMDDRTFTQASLLENSPEDGSKVESNGTAKLSGARVQE